MLSRMKLVGGAVVALGAGAALAQVPPMDSSPVVRVVPTSAGQTTLSYAPIVKAAAHYDVAIEVNNSSLTVSRKGSLPHCDHIVSLAKTFGTKLIVGSDSHYCETVGEFSVAAELLAKHGVSPEQVLNTSLEKVLAHLNRRSNHKKVEC